MKTFKNFVVEKKLTPKDIKRALASIKPPKKKPTLPKAPWDDKEQKEATDAEYHKTLGPTKNYDEGIAALKKKHGMSHDKAVSTLKRLMGMAAKPRKEEVEQVDEVLDTPKAWNSYMRKSNTSLNKARDKSIFGRTDKAKDKANKTILKRIKGQDMAGKIPDKQFNKATGAGYVNNKNESVELDESAAAAAAAKTMIDRDNEDRRRQTRRWDAEDAAKKSSASKKQTSKPETPAERKARRHAADQVHFGEVATHHRTKAAEHEKMAKEHDKKTKGISGKLFGGKHKEAARLNNAAAQAHQKAAEVADKVHKAASGKKTSYSSQDAYHKHNDAAIRASGDVHTHKLTKMRESVELDEVLDTPKAMDSYKNKAKYSKDRAANSAAAKMLRNKNGFHSTDTSQELKTMDKRTKGLKMADKNAMKKTFKALRGEEVELDEAQGTAAKYAGKSGIFGGKYTSTDRMLDMKNFNAIRDKRAKQRDAEHKEQDPKMSKMGYAKHMLDTDKADAKARKRGIDPTGKYDKYKKTNGIREEIAEAKTPSDADLHKTLGPTKNIQQGVEALKKKHGMSDAEAKKHIRRLMGEEVEQVDEVLDTPKAFNSYMRKSNTSLNNARNKHAFGRTDKAKDKAMKTILKRSKGRDMAGKIPDKQFNKAVGKGYNESVELDEQTQYDLVEAYLLENNIDIDTLSEQELNEIIGKVLGKAVGGAFKLGAKAAVGAGRLAKKAVVNKQGNMRGTQAAKNDAMRAQNDKLRKQRAEIVKKRLEQRKGAQLQRSVEREKAKLAASKNRAAKA